MATNHTLRITPAVTGANPMVFLRHIAPGYDWRDFDGCLDAPAQTALGSTVRLEYEWRGVVVASNWATTLITGRSEWK